jgi:uncharacterized phage-associated protein
MSVPYSSIVIANSFLSLNGAHDGIEHMKLQKLVYCAYGWWLADAGLDGQRLTIDKPEIWKHGPVFPKLYQAFKVFGRKPITEAQSLSPFAEAEIVPADDVKVNSLVRWIWKRYGHLSSFALSDMTHAVGTPWYRVAEERNFSVPLSTTIPDGYILEEFQNLMQQDRAKATAIQADRIPYHSL